MLSAFFNAETGPFKHKALAGIRFTEDQDLGGAAAQQQVDLGLGEGLGAHGAVTG